MWDPYTKSETKLIEAVQRRAARYVLNQHHSTSSVGSKLTQLNWPTLECRRQRSRLNMFYKIQNNLVAINREQFLTTSTRTSRGGVVLVKRALSCHQHWCLTKWSYMKGDHCSKGLLERGTTVAFNEVIVSTIATSEKFRLIVNDPQPRV